MLPTIVNHIVTTAIVPATTANSYERFNDHSVGSEGTLANLQSILRAAKTLTAMITAIVVFIIIVVVLSLIGKYLWNSVIAGEGINTTGLFSQIKPMNSISEIIGIYVLISLLLN